MIKGPVGKSFFPENLPSQLFNAAVANADTESFKSLHTLFDTCMLAKFEPTQIFRNVQHFELFDKISIQRHWRHFERRFLCWNNCLTVNFKTIIFRRSINYGSPTCETRLNIPPNMADLTSMKHAVSNLMMQQRRCNRGQWGHLPLHFSDCGHKPCIFLSSAFRATAWLFNVYRSAMFRTTNNLLACVGLQYLWISQRW